MQGGKLASLPCVIFSADQRPHSVELVRSMLAESTYVGYELVGGYKGELELSWMIAAASWQCMHELRHHCRDQETVLLLGPVEDGEHRKATLVGLHGGRPEEIGNFVPVAYEDAIKSDAWTMDPVSCTWYICK